MMLNKYEDNRVPDFGQGDQTVRRGAKRNEHGMDNVAVVVIVELASGAS